MGLREYKALLKEGGAYSIYVLFVLLITYLLNQLDRYIVGIVSGPMARSVHFGSKSCMTASAAGLEDVSSSNLTYLTSVSCTKIKNEESCLSNDCVWDYDGTGFDYQLLAGPVFTVIYTFSGIPIGIIAGRYNRKTLLAFFLLLWSFMTLVSGFCNEFWQLILARMGLGLGEAGCTPFASSIVADYFAPSSRATAMGVYNWGIYTGYSMAYAIGNFVESDLNWRYVFYIAAIPGFLVAGLILLTVREPRRGASDPTHGTAPNQQRHYSLKEILVYFATSPSLLLLCFGGAFRNAGGYVWGLNTELFFENYHGLTKPEIGRYMSWIPLVGGSLGAVFGGFISDRFVKKSGVHARLWVLIISQLVAAPFAFGALYLTTSPPLAFLSLIPSNIIGEMWVGVTLAVLMEMVPNGMRTAAVAVYLFIISNIGGNANILLPVLENHMSQQKALIILFPGLYVVGSIFFMLCLLSVNRDVRIKRERELADEERTPLVLNDS